jgi:hypothetical protein
LALLSVRKALWGCVGRKVAAGGGGVGVVRGGREDEGEGDSMVPVKGQNC